MPQINSLEGLKECSEYGRYIADIMGFYAPLILGLPKLRSNPELMQEKVKAKSSSGIADIVTQADVYVQKQIKKKIKLLYPDWQFWGEEGADNASKFDESKTMLVVADPIEGTNNFKYFKDDQWGSVLGLVNIKSRQPVAGIVAHPSKGKFYIGVKGCGASELIYRDGQLAHFSQMRRSAEHGQFTYNNSPHFNIILAAKVKNFLKSGTVKKIENGDELERSRPDVAIKKGNASYSFTDPESGALEVVRFKGTICFKTSNEMAAVFPIIEELGGKITDGDGRSWHLGIDSLISARTSSDYDLLKGMYDKARS